MTKQDRSNGYWMKRLEEEHPAIFADRKSGKYASDRQALLAAGLRHPQKQINALKNAWEKASATDRSDFLLWLGAAVSSSGSVTPSSATSMTSGTSAVATATRQMSKTSPASAILGPERHLLPGAKSRIRSIMKARNMRQSDVLREMGYTNAHDASLGMALSDCNPTTVRRDLAAALEKWLDANNGVA